MHRISVAVAVLVAALPLAGLLQNGAKAESIDFGEMRRDLETMRRILDRHAFDTKSVEAKTGGTKVGRASSGEGKASSGEVRNEGAASDNRAGEGQSGGIGGSAVSEDLAATLYNYTYSTGEGRGSYVFSGSGNSEAFYVPGDGALFLLRTTTVLTPPAEVSDKSEGKETSLWDDVRAEVDGKSRPNVSSWFTRARGTYDAATVDGLKSRLLTALAKYGAKIGQLSDSQHLTIVVRGGYGDAHGGTISGRVTGAGGGRVPGATVMSTDPLDMLVVGEGIGSVLTIRVSRADVASFAAGSLDLDAFKQRAKIAQY